MEAHTCHRSSWHTPHHTPDCEYTFSRTFLKEAGPIQALRGFESDVIIFNSEWGTFQSPGCSEEISRELGGMFLFLNRCIISFKLYAVLKNLAHRNNLTEDQTGGSESVVPLVLGRM